MKCHILSNVTMNVITQRYIICKSLVDIIISLPDVKLNDKYVCFIALTCAWPHKS